MSKTLYAGWSSRSITPMGTEVSLAGQYYERLTSEVESELEVTALALDNGDESFTWVSCDLSRVSAILCNDVREAVKRKAPEIRTANIFLSAIHTHTAPHLRFDPSPGIRPRFSSAEDELKIGKYHQFVVDQITDAVIEANHRKTANCSIHTGVSPVMTGFCRRGIINTGEAVMYIDVKRPDFVRMEAPDGGPMNFMYLKDGNGILKGVAACVPCPAQVLEHQFFISSDYAGRVRKLLKNKYGDDFLYLPLISSAGDLSPRNLVTKDYGSGNMYGRDGADILARRIFDAIVAEECRPVETVTDFSTLRAVSNTITLPGWIPTEEEYKWALSLKDSDTIKFDIKDYVQKGVEPYFRTPLALAKRVETILTRYENREYYKEIISEIAAVRIGTTVWVSNPFELFQEHASLMTARSKARSFWSIQLTYTSFGYFPTKAAAAAGGYGAFITSSRVDPFNAGEILVSESVALADSLFAERV